MTETPRSALAAAAAALLPLAAALALAWTATVLRPAEAGGRLVPVEIGSAAALQHLFAKYDYDWPPDGPVPPLGLVHLPDDLGTLAPERKKRLFLRAVLPLVIATNDRIRDERRFILQALSDGAPAASRRLQRLAARYRVSGSLATPAARAQLLRRCDTVPAGLVLAQAAQESGWGTSAFAVTADNLFGVWTWDAESGLVPAERGAGARHLVRTYPDLAASVRDYLYNLNVGHAYAAFRKLRARERAAGHAPKPLALARTLHRYSQRRSEYVETLSSLMLENGLEQLPRLRLAASPVPGSAGQLTNARDRSQ